MICYMPTHEEIAVLNTDYSRKPMNRTNIQFCLAHHRGYVEPRLARGLYRTEEEQERWINEGLAIKLPGCK